MKNQPKFTYDEMIEHLKGDGVEFNIASEEQARLFLSLKNYFFKINSYKRILDNDNVKLHGFDFIYLEDISTIDSHLRKYLLDISLDIEHYLKVKILHYITNDPNEDGYKIVKRFRINNPEQYSTTMTYFKYDNHSKELYKKAGSNPPAWIFLEFADFGTLIKFVEFYSREKNFKQLIILGDQVKFVKNIRNRAAHSKSILSNVFDSSSRIKRVKQAMLSVGHDMNIPSDLIKYKEIHDLISVFYLLKTILPKEKQHYYFDKGIQLISLMNVNSTLYNQGYYFAYFVSEFKKMIDFIKIT